TPDGAPHGARRAASYTALLGAGIAVLVIAVVLVWVLVRG
ncbi:hypothetical protein GA0115246_109725, partial [Streptomyces sp. SolWspMP-sol7th]